MNNARAGQTIEGYGRPLGLLTPPRQPVAVGETHRPTRERGRGRPAPNGAGLRGHVGERQIRGAVRGAAA
jgi:hypothetical protein